MVKKTVGYVRLEWTCPNCGTKNPGPQKLCTGCGSPQPADVQFEQAAEEKLIADQKEIEQAKAGPDIHCPYCGARNPRTAKTCGQCGGDLSEGAARAAGRVVGAHRDKPAAPVPCPSCGTLNPATALKCSKCGASMARRPEPPPRQAAGRPVVSPLVYIIGAAAILLCIGLGFFLTRTNDVVGVVEDVSWKRNVVIEELGPVTRQGWLDEIPTEGVVGTCTQRVHHTQSSPAPNSQEVCGTPYTVDTGSGHGEVAQDCEYQVYADWCEYQVNEWHRVDQATSSGNDLSPRWPGLQLAADQREAERGETYEIVFDTDGGTYSYQTDDMAEFARFQVGSRWLLTVNNLNSVVSVTPAR